MTGSGPHGSNGRSLPLSILDSFREGCQVIGRDWTYLYLNDAAAAQGRRTRQELLGRTMMEAYPGIESTPMFALLRRCMEQRTHEGMENEFAYPDGSRGWFDLRFVPVPEGVFVLSLDISRRMQDQAERRTLEAQLEQSQKLETIGQLAGGIAHDFNNLLAVILGHAEFALQAVGETDPVHAHLLQILHAAESAAGLTHQLLAFSRRQVLQPVVLNLNQVVGRLEGMVRRLVGDHIEVATALAPDLANVRADPGQIEQVLLNLVVNSRDAMPSGGRIVVTTANADLDHATVRQKVVMTPGRYVMLAVTDTGIGMDAETRERMFEPFFTTKEPGKGTGLGMSTVYGIVRQSEGTIWVYSEPGQGTTIRIYLPVDTSGAPAVEPGAGAPVAPAAGETILVVEDQPKVREIAALILEEEGYAVLTAANGDEALALSAQLDGAIHLLLTDVVMPRMSGRQLAARLTERYPGLRVLYMSGYTDDLVAQQGALEQGAAFIDKPFNAATLLRRVREVLDA